MGLISNQDPSSFLFDLDLKIFFFQFLTHDKFVSVWEVRAFLSLLKN